MESPAWDGRRDLSVLRRCCGTDSPCSPQALQCPTRLSQAAVGQEAAPPLASAVGIVVSSKGINVTLCRAVSVTVPCGFLGTNICPHRSLCFL